MSFRRVAVFDHVEDQRRALGNLLKTGDYSDFVIICGKARHKVHKAIICLRSDFFKAACTSGFKEAQTGEVELPDDEPLTTAAASIPREALGPYVFIIPYVALRVHYKVYALGEKYGIPGLKALAAHNFETECEDVFSSSKVQRLEDLIHEMRERTPAPPKVIVLFATLLSEY
ncbi:kelch 4 [Fusarium mexicanum]|uniref:Kelch 4 n=1 Tax=Fusarium mexicanum TaxID=751941 RepID=A0A8H5JJK9_9HYPO|nr:kelch 4 [Fusarium mexicanum]